MLFEWDAEKAKKNKKKHGIDFETAAYVFDDDNRLEMYDELHSIQEDRYIVIGSVGHIEFVLTVVYTERHEKIRIISARRAMKKEKELYYDNSERNRFE